MILSDAHVRQRLLSGSIVLDPPVSDSQIGPRSVDLTLGSEFLLFSSRRHLVIKLEEGAEPPEDLMSRVVVRGDEGESFMLLPGAFVLGSTVESIKMPPDLAGTVDGRSSLGRLGLQVHSTAHSVEPGFEGTITLELLNVGPHVLALRPGIRVCSLTFEVMSGPVFRHYGSKPGAKYVGQRGPRQSEFWKD